MRDLARLTSHSNWANERRTFSVRHRGEVTFRPTIGQRQAAIHLINRSAGEPTWHTGDSGQGLTHGVIGSLLIPRLILSGKADWEEFYSPGRKTGSAVKNFIAENIAALKSFAEYVAPGELSSVDELKPGQGAIIREGMSKIAAYRNETGRLHRRSAVCSHLGCHIHWNSFEKCWDCPCHGSQFSIDGAVLNAPSAGGN
jgi:nitrite reductase/ring-hydroxylating ferredoxin subunit